MLETAWESRWVPDHGGVAQLGEHLPCKQGVRGSNPLISTSDLGHLIVPRILCILANLLSRFENTSCFASDFVGRLISSKSIAVVL